MPTPPLPEQPGRTPVPYERRDAAFVQWLDGRDLGCRGSKQHVNLIARDAFNAGWEARKLTDYGLMTNREKVLDSVRRSVQSIFPTDAELGAHE